MRLASGSVLNADSGVWLSRVPAERPAVEEKSRWPSTSLSPASVVWLAAESRGIQQLL